MNFAGFIYFAFKDNFFQAENPSNHATVLSILKRKQGIELPEACCVPKKMDSLTLLFFDSDGSVVLKTYPQMSVKSCGCR